MKYGSTGVLEIFSTYMHLIYMHFTQLNCLITTYCHMSNFYYFVLKKILKSACVCDWNERHKNEGNLECTQISHLYFYIYIHGSQHNRILHKIN